MAIVVDKAKPLATTTPDESVAFAASVAEPHICTMNTGGDTLISGPFPAEDDRGLPDTGIDWTQAGTDLDR